MFPLIIKAWQDTKQKRTPHHAQKKISFKKKLNICYWKINHFNFWANVIAVAWEALSAKSPFLMGRLYLTQRIMTPAKQHLRCAGFAAVFILNIPNINTQGLLIRFTMMQFLFNVFVVVKTPEWHRLHKPRNASSPKTMPKNLMCQVLTHKLWHVLPVCQIENSKDKISFTGWLTVRYDPN